MKPSAEQKLASLMANAHPERVKQGPRAVVALPSLRAGDLHLGEFDTGGPIGIDLRKLMEGRLLVQGASGAGKSWTLRRLLEESSGLVQQILVDPEGEFRSLAERFDLTVIDGTKFDTAALAVAAARAREHRVSVLLDLSQVDREDQMKAMAAFVGQLVQAPREHWHPCLVAIDEAHLFAPFGGQTSEPSSVRKAAIGAVVDLMSRGRKRGLAGVLATQRLARLSKSVASEVLNFLVGLNTLDLDIRRAAETVGWDARRAFDRLPMLSPGEFVAVGPAFSRSPSVCKVGPVQTRHIGAAPALSPPLSVTPKGAAELLELQALEEATAADRAVIESDAIIPGLKAMREFVRDPGFPIAGLVVRALVPMMPQGATIAALASHLGVPGNDLVRGLALLDRLGFLEFTEDGASRAVRIIKQVWTPP